jgi:phosphoribosylamine-glycine ligase
MRLQLLDNDAESMGLDLALRAQDAGHEVKYWLPSTPGEKPLPYGNGLVEKVSDWDMQWADLIVTTGNSTYGERLEEYFTRGYPIFGANREGASLELDRAKGQEVLASCGVKTIPYTIVESAEEAIELIRTTDEPYAMKPHGGEADKALTCVASTPDEAIFTIQKWEKDGKFPEGLMMQERIEGVEMGIAGWFGPAGWNTAIEESFEHKKMMNDDYGPNTGEMGCYDEETEVLTRAGWKFWRDVSMSDEIASLQDGKTVFERPSEVVSYDYVGPMVCWENQTLDICVTPNHNMYVNSQWDARRDVDGYKFVQASDCVQSQYEILRTAEWKGDGQFCHKIPSYKYRSGWGFITEPEIEIPLLDWAPFLGLYIAEGSTSVSVNIAQSHPEKASKAEEIIRATGFPYSRKKHGFNIYRRQLSTHLKPLGRSWEKRVPDYIKNASTSVIEAFLDGYALGDGHQYENGWRMFYTSNKGLADDVQELLLKIGRVGVIKNRGIRTAVKYAPDGHQIIQRRDAYEIVERVKKSRSWLDTRDRSTRMYSGKVYCATVTGHVMYVRRNGKPLWCGNTVLRHVTQSKLFDLILAPLTDYLHSIHYVGCCSVNCIIDRYGNPMPLEFTNRLGWPAFCITQEVLQGDPIQWMYDLLHYGDTLQVSTKVAMGVLLAHGDFPACEDAPDVWTGFPITGITDENYKHLHFQQVCAGTAPKLQAGKIEAVNALVTAGPYVLIAGGSGKSVSEARDATYGVAKSLDWPSDLMIRTDIGVRLKKDLPIIQEFGYADGMVY